MSRAEALKYCEDHELHSPDLNVVLGPGYIQCELQFIWDHDTHEPINGIMSLGFTKGEAQKLWNAGKTR